MAMKILFTVAAQVGTRKAAVMLNVIRFEETDSFQLANSTHHVFT
jgi:hypothetical protein